MKALLKQEKRGREGEREIGRKPLWRNKAHLPNMQKAVEAIWHHYASTEDNQMHDYCSRRTGSWCKRQKDPANGTISSSN